MALKERQDRDKPPSLIICQIDDLKDNADNVVEPFQSGTESLDSQKPEGSSDSSDPEGQAPCAPTNGEDGSKKDGTLICEPMIPIEEDKEEDQGPVDPIPTTSKPQPISSIFKYKWFWGFFGIVGIGFFLSQVALLTNVSLMMSKPPAAIQQTPEPTTIYSPNPSAPPVTYSPTKAPLLRGQEQLIDATTTVSLAGPRPSEDQLTTNILERPEVPSSSPSLRSVVRSSLPPNLFQQTTTHPPLAPSVSLNPMAEDLSLLSDLSECQSNSECTGGQCAYNGTQAVRICCPTGPLSDAPLHCGGLPDGFDCGPFDTQTQANTMCQSGICINHVCTSNLLEDYDLCQEDADCSNGACRHSGYGTETFDMCCPNGATASNDYYCAGLPVGSICGRFSHSNSMCESGLCINQACASEPLEDFVPCLEDADCKSSACRQSMNGTDDSLLCCPTDVDSDICRAVGP